MSMRRADEFHGRWNTVTRPLRVTCDDGRRYVVKAQQHGCPTRARSLVNGYVISRLGAVIGAPIPPVALVNLSDSFLLEHGLADVLSGLAVGSLELDGVQEANCAATFRASLFDGWMIPNELLPVLRAPENRARVARLAVLFAWAGVPGPAWREVLYARKQPPLVHVVDVENHGRELPEDVSDWLALALDVRVGLTLADLQAAAGRVEGVSRETIAAVTETPDEWGARWTADLVERRASLLSALHVASAAEARVA